MKVMRGTCAVD